MTIKMRQFFSKMLFAPGSVFIVLAAMAAEVVYAGPADMRKESLRTSTSTMTSSDGSFTTTTYNPLTGEEKFEDHNRPDGKVITATTDHRTGEYEHNQTTTDPKTGDVKRTTFNRDKNGKWTLTETTINAGGSHSETYEAKTGPDDTHLTRGAKISETDTYPMGGQKKTTFDPKTGHITSRSEKDPNGSTRTTKYAGNCGPFGGSDCHVTSKSSYDAKNGLQSHEYCDKNGKCSRVTKEMIATPRAETKQDVGVAIKKFQGAEKPKGDFTAARDKVKADVLGQIESKPRGDRTGERKKIQTGVLDKPKVGALQVKPKARDIVVGRKDKLGAIPRSRSTGQVIQGADSTRQKPQTRAVQPYKGKLQVREQKDRQSEKVSATRRSQAAAQMQSQGVASNRNRVQPQSAEPFKGKSKVQDWGSPAGSSAPLQRLR